jgi:hypothetical protein
MKEKYIGDVVQKHQKYIDTFYGNIECMKNLPREIFWSTLHVIPCPPQ